MLGAAQADALGAEVARHLRVARRVGVGAHAKPPELVGPRHQLAEVVAERRLNRRHSSEEDSSGRAVNGDPLALGDDNAVDVELLLAVINVQNARAAHAGLAHAARDYSRMARHPPARRHNRLRRDHAVEVVGACLLPDEHDLLALARHLLGLVRIEDDFALRRAGAGGQAFRDDLRVGVRVNSRVQKLVKLFGRDAAHGCRLVNQTFVHHVHGDLDGGRARALARARLEHEEASALDCELHVLHVVVVALQQLDDVSELLVDGGQFFLQLADGLRRADACDHVLALRVQEILAIELLLPRRGVAREGHARAALRAHVAEDHRLHVDRRAEVVGDTVDAAVVARAPPHPGVEDGGDGDA